MASLIPKEAFQAVKVGSSGFVKLLDILPRLPKCETLRCDEVIPDAARISYGEGTRKVQNDKALLRYLLHHQHMSPFEMVETVWQVKAPIFVLRQWDRHRTASKNEMSARYSIMPHEVHVPEAVREQSDDNKQCSSGIQESVIAKEFMEFSKGDEVFKKYHHFIKAGIPREQARMILPQNLMTSMILKTNLRNLMHFLWLRMDNHAQKEIRDYADAMFGIMKHTNPITMQAFEDYHLGSVNLSAGEIESIRTGQYDRRLGKREKGELKDKLKVLGLEWL